MRRAAKAWPRSIQIGLRVDTALNRNAGNRLAGVILAGGRSRRMGGGIKALIPLAGKSLLQHVIDRLDSQVARLYLSVEKPAADFDRFGLPQLPDPEPGSNGPLGGLLAALERSAEDVCDGLLLLPCDAPFLPRDLGARLLACADDENADVAVVRHASRLQPTFSLWRRSVLPDVERAVLDDGMAGFKQFLATHRHAVLDWAGAGANPFFNINDPDALEAAARMIASSPSQQ